MSDVIPTDPKTEDWPPRIRVDPKGGLRLVLTMLYEHRITVDQAMECFSDDSERTS